MPFTFSIFRLLRSGYPSAVTRFIVSVVVNALYGQIISIAVGQRPVAEGSKVNPIVAKRYAATTVVTKPFFVRVGASIFDATPDRIKAGIPTAVAGVFCHSGHCEPPTKVRCQVTGRCWKHRPVAQYSGVFG